MTMDPFADHPRNSAQETRSLNEKKYSMSRLFGIRVGDIRQTFGQMRIFRTLNKHTMLWYGITVGEFCLAYVLHNARSAVDKRKED